MALAVRAPRPLSDIEAEIVDLKAEADRDFREGNERYHRIGECLIEAKAQLPHGAFGAWVEQRFGWSRQHAAEIMKIPPHWNHLQGEMSDGSDIGRRCGR
jgi:hypothetical protein